MSDDEILDRLPGIRVDNDNVAWFGGLLDRKLMINHCQDCGHWHHPPRSICPRCWSRAIDAEQVGGRGVVELLTVLHMGPRRGGADYTDGWPVVGVTLEEQAGLRVTGTLVGVDREDVSIGMAVEVRWIDTDEGPPMVAFTPTGTDGQ